MTIMTRDELTSAVAQIQEDLQADFSTVPDDSFYFEIARSVLENDPALADAIRAHTRATDVEGWLAGQL